MLDEVENICSTFEEMKKNESYYSKDLVTKIKPIDHSIGFENCLIACCRNGGMIAFVKKTNYFLMDASDPIRDNIRVFFQNGTGEKRIRIREEKDKKIVLFDFTDEEKLYIVLSEGSVFKVDIFNQKLLSKPKSTDFEGDTIRSARIFGKGFVALTLNGNFVVTKSFSEPNAAAIFFPMGSLLGVDECDDYLFLPDNVTKSKKIELLITNPKGHGLVHVVEQPNNQFSMTDTEHIQGVSFIKNNEIVPYDRMSGSDAYTSNDLGKISAFAISPSKRKICFYRKDGSFFVTSTNLETIDLDLGQFQIPETRDKNIKEEVRTMFENPSNCDLFSHEDDLNCQLSQILFCGDDSVCLCGRKYVLLTIGQNKTLFFKMLKKAASSDPKEKFIHCISEVDGLRSITKEGVFIISKVPDDLYKSCYTFSEDNSKKLMKAYNSATEKKADCDNEIRSIIKTGELHTAVKTLQNAAANLWKKKEQLFMLKASQHGKSFVQKGDYNFNLFVDVCKDIRIVNNLQMSDSPRFITYREYKKMNSNDLINKLLRNQDFYLAYEISNYLKLNVKKVYQSMAIAQMKSMGEGSTRQEELDMYERIQKKLCNVPNISYIKLAKKAFKFGKQEMGIKFLENEKSILTKIPQYIELKKWPKALELAYQTYDTNVLITVIDKIMKNQSVEEFCNIVGKDQNINAAVIEYLKKNYPNELDTYLRSKENYEELFFQTIEKFFKSSTLDERKRNLRDAKEYLDKIGQIKGTTFDLKFYRTYVKDIESSILTTTEFLKENIIQQTDTSPFDNSVYDVFKSAIKKEKIGKVEQKNKMFDISKKKLSIMRIRTYAETRQFDGIDAMYNNGDFKKYDLSLINFAEVYVDYGMKDKAAEVLKKITDSDYFDYKIELLKYIEKYADALECIISDRNCDNKCDLVNDILSKHPDLRPKVDELCAKYKVQL